MLGEKVSTGGGRLVRRKERERLLNNAIDAVYGLAVLAGLFTWLSTRSVWLGLAVVAAAVLLLAVGLKLWRTWRDRRLRATGVADIAQLSGEAFEEVLVAHFRAQGYVARLTPNGADFGADLVLERDGQKTVVQAKRWSGTVGVRAVQEVVAARAHYKATKAMVVTSSGFTDQAVQLARSNAVELWDGERLSREFDLTGRLAVSPPAVGEPAAMATEAPVICPACGSPMVRRNGRYGEFWGCSKYPACRGTRPV